MAREQDLMRASLSPEELNRLLSKATKVQGLEELLAREQPDVSGVIEHLDARRKHLKDTFSRQLRGAFADEVEVCRKLPGLLQTGEVGISDLRAMFSPKETQAVTESTQAGRTPSRWEEIRTLFRRRSSS